MNLHLYSDELFSIQIDLYAFGDVTYTDETPHKLIQYAMTDKEQFANAISNDQGQLIGFFGLHLGAGPEAFGYKNRACGLIKGMSIDARYRGNGYAPQCFERIFEFINTEIDATITHLILGVNEKNIFAQKAYEKANFKKTTRTLDGKFGPLIVMEKKKTA